MPIILKEDTAASIATPASGKATVFVDSGELKIKDEAGRVTSFIGSVPDGDKGDVVVSSSGTVWTLDSAVVTAAAKTVLDDASVSDMRTTLGLAIGTNVQAYDADLGSIAGLSPSNDDLIQRKSGSWTNRTIAQVKADMGNLGTYTWADLQAAYPNGGGALAALPAGAVAWVEETAWHGWVTPNIGKTYWSVVSPTSVVLDTTMQTGAADGTHQVVKSSLLPVGLLRAGRKIIIKGALGKNGATDASTTVQARIGTAGTTADSALLSFPAMSAAQRSTWAGTEWKLASATSFQSIGPPNNNWWSASGGASTIVGQAWSVAIANVDTTPLYISLSAQLAGSTNAPQAFHLEIELVP